MSASARPQPWTCMGIPLRCCGSFGHFVCFRTWYSNQYSGSVRETSSSAMGNSGDLHSSLLTLPNLARVLGILVLGFLWRGEREVRFDYSDGAISSL